ncbi:ABC transporter ATP-binding protein [Bacillus solitudinis]|uniref:ABC transporter ATP-binding protein n=1 Tax=Bacillus solitudinis TaxID=2014074 RepID=UPI000C24EE77|nr:ABC transporter ATP-binding protein [Bacillus solitudinis]
MKKVISFLKPYRFLIWVALILMFLELVVELIQPLLLAKIIDDGILARDLNVVIKWGLLMLGLSFIAFISGIINSFYAADVSQSTGYDIRSSLYKKIQTFSFSSLERFATSSLITRMTNDVTQIQNTIFMGLRIMLRAPLVVLGGTGMILTVNLKIGVIFLLTIPFIMVLLIWVVKKGRGFFSQVQEKLDGVNHILRENLIGIRLIKAFVRRKHEGERFSLRNKELMERTVTALRLMEIAMPLLLLLMNVAIIAVLWFGNISIQTGGVQVGEVVAIVNYATRITAAFTIFSMIIVVFSRARASAERISEVLEMEDPIIFKEPLVRRTLKSGKIEFRNVSFRYANSEESVLENISFKVESGQTVAILGATGSGKSSLFQLIPRLYDVEQGEILIDDQPINEIEESELRPHIGYVPQEALLFSGTIKENIAWGKDNSSTEEIINAVKDAQIYETISSLPNAFDTKIGQKGINLSGGQKQRLSIARALIRKPMILLLDDSTSALDVKTEARFIDALSDYSCTMLIITQKLSTATKADYILLLDEGKLIASGEHQLLLNESSLYRKLYYSQFREEVKPHA